MVYTCSICAAVARSIVGLCSHIKLFHPRNLLTSYRCCHCPNEYTTVQLLKEHLNDTHPDDVIMNNVPDNINVCNDVLDDPNAMEVDEPEPMDGPPVPLGNQIVEAHQAMTVRDFRRALFQSSLSYSAKLYSNISMNRSKVQEMVNLTSDFASSGFLDINKHKTISLLTDHNVPNEEVHDLNEMFSSMQNSFLGLKTESQRVRALENSDCFVHPKKFHVGVREVIKRVNGEQVRTPVELTGQYISIKQVLKKFFELPGVLDATLNNIQMLRGSNTFTNIVQSPIWRNIERTHFQNKLVLPLILYYDDAEADNGMGSHAGVHSLGMVYYQIPCIPQHLLSLLDNIFVAMVFLTSDYHRGNEETFRLIINDLKDLETEGIQVITDNQVYQIHFAMPLLIGDNKGINTVTGYVGCFTANYYCRICKEHRNVMRTQLRENRNVLRNPENYALDILVNNYTLTGIKRQCLWNELNSFHATVNVGVDFMHDIFEGVCHYVLVPVLSGLIRQGYFTLETLNERVQFFDYGFDAGNKPSIIKPDHLNSDKLKMSASEMYFFVRHLGLMIGDLVVEEIDEWRLYTLLAEIIDIISAPYVRIETVPYLGTLIAEHHELYQRVTGQTLKPKHHFMIHYPRLMTLIGPLIFLWCMRMEWRYFCRKTKC